MHSNVVTGMLLPAALYVERVVLPPKRMICRMRPSNVKPLPTCFQVLHYSTEPNS